jgi:hypothetical protein
VGFPFMVASEYMTPAEIQAVAATAGFSGADLDTAVAIALAETNPPGNPSSYNPESQKGTPQGQGSYGLWQIYLWKHPEFAGINLMDPQENAHAAYQVYSQHGFTPWTTYTSGKYRAFLHPAPYVPPADLPGSPYQGPGSPVLTLDAATGLPVETATIAPDIFSIGPSPAPDFGTVLLWGAVGLFALWIFSESV